MSTDPGPYRDYVARRAPYETENAAPETDSRCPLDRQDKSSSSVLALPASSLAFL